MRFLTGDDTGILKWVRVEAQKVQKLGGPRRRGDAVERLCWAGPASKREARIGIAYASGTVEVREAASGAVLGSFAAPPSIRCLQTLEADLVVVSKDGTVCILADWCADEFTSSPAEGRQPAEPAEGEAAPEPQQEEGVRRFQLPAPITSAQLEPVAGSRRLAFGGDENDVKIFDVAKGEIVWRAKNMPENSLCLRIPIKLSSLQWASGCAPSRSLLLVGTTDGKVRLYDASKQRRPLFEMKIGHKNGEGTAGYTGTADDLARPVNCSMVHQTHNGAWSIFIGNTMGVLREFDLKALPDCEAAPMKPGRKSHWDWAARQLPLRRGYRGIMGAIRAVDVHESGGTLVAVGLGRFAYVFDTKKRRIQSKVYLKQKLCSVLLSEEPHSASGGTGSDEEDDGDITGDEHGAKAGDQGDEEDLDNAEDEIQEGFSDDEDADEDKAGARSGDDGSGEAPAAEAEASLAKRKKGVKRKRGATPKGKAKAKPGKKRARKTV